MLKFKKQNTAELDRLANIEARLTKLEWILSEIAELLKKEREGAQDGHRSK
jgi:hypothetical protein